MKFILNESVKYRLGVDFYKMCLKSLQEHFKKHEVIEEFVYENEPLKIIHVENIHPRSDAFFEFYVEKKVSNVYYLKYKSVVG